jgi:hypothetical protein
MDVTKKKLVDAVEENIISPHQAVALYKFLEIQSQDIPKFTFISLKIKCIK